MRFSPVVFWDFDGTIARRQNRWSGALLDAWKVVEPTTTATVDQLRPHLKSGFPWHDPDTIREAPSPAEWWARVEVKSRGVVSFGCFLLVGGGQAVR